MCAASNRSHTSGWYKIIHASLGTISEVSDFSLTSEILKLRILYQFNHFSDCTIPC